MDQSLFDLAPEPVAAARPAGDPLVATLRHLADAAAGDPRALAAAREGWGALTEEQRAVLGPVGRLVAARTAAAPSDPARDAPAGPAPAASAPPSGPAPAASAPPSGPAPAASAPAAAGAAPDDAFAALLADHAHLTDADLVAEAPEVVPLEDALPPDARIEAPAGPREVGIPGAPDPEALLSRFGLPGFRPGQREAVEGALQGRDALVVMPTGGGKSLCYQLPAVASDALTVVVSPLIALIADQHRRLEEVGARSVMLAGTLGEEHNRAGLAAVRDGSAQVVFCAPERFASRALRAALAHRRIALFVVDEAHCVSEWGHDFRPDYLRLGPVLDELGRPPVMALTATATPKVAREVVARLGLQDPVMVRRGFDRPNLSFDVLPFDGEGSVARKRGTLLNGLADPANQPAIVYCGTRKQCEEVTEVLTTHGVGAVTYHAGLPPEARAAAQAAFMAGRTPVVVATNAFGMGVDKADVRSVWHWALPTSVEAYYQEAGRAGRDGAPGRAVLLASRSDLGRLVQFIRQAELHAEDVQRLVDRLARTAQGGRTTADPRRMGDADRVALAVAERAGALELRPAAAGTLEIALVARLDLGRARALCREAAGRRWDAYGALKAFAASGTCRRRQLLDHFGDDEPGAPEGRCCDVCHPVDWVTVPDKGVRAPGAKAPAAPPVELAPADAPLHEALRAWRTRAAEGKPAYTVATNATLATIAGTRPRTPAELLAVKGVGPSFMDKWGDEVLGVVAGHPRA